MASSIGGGGETVRMRISFQPSSNAAPPTYQGKCVVRVYIGTRTSLFTHAQCLYIAHQLVSSSLTPHVPLFLLCARTVASGGEFGKNDGGFGFSRSPMPAREGGAALARDRDNSSRSHRRYASTPKNRSFRSVSVSACLSVTVSPCLSLSLLVSPCLCLSLPLSASLCLSLPHAASLCLSLLLFLPATH